MSPFVGRRSFIKTAGSLALATISHSLPAFSSEDKSRQRKPRIAVFFEPSFPIVDGVALDQQTLRQAFEGWDAVFLNSTELGEQLTADQCDIVVMPYGSAFPRDAWGVIVKYLRAGGNWLNLGGCPFAVPIDRESNGWREGVRQTAYHKRLGITQVFTVGTTTISSYQSTEDQPWASALVGEFTADKIHELYVRFTETVDFPNEGGSPGARDATLRPLVVGHSDNDRRLAAPIIQIDRMQGDYVGGRWILANFSGSVTAKAMRALAEMALQGSMELTARSSFACYREGEVPSFTVQCRRPKGGIERLVSDDCRIEVSDERDRHVESLRVQLRGEGTVVTGYAGMKRSSLSPGLYRVRIKQKVKSLSSDSNYSLTHSTGFWVFDRNLLEGGKSFTVDKDYLLQDGKPYVVTGTTYMGSDVHRKFLFEPNPYLWDKDSAEMKADGMNMIRTGIWSGWRNYMLDVGAPDESVLRALDAFLLTARRHDLPVIFTLFAFLPETWGGVNAYLDPRSVNAQKEFVTMFAQRYRGMNQIIWDLINEPSFCNPQYLWSCRPNYDRYEQNEWSAWLKRRYQFASEEEHDARIHEIYRAAQDEPITLPRLEEFADVNVLTENRPIKVMDYRLFAQEMFARWVKEMNTAIRANGNPHQLVTVGQDEGGTNESPSPHFFGETTDFTCVHNWWLNDNLVWDNVIMRTWGKPNLVEETGMMFYEKMDGSSWRTEESTRDLLERKLAISLGVGGAGFVEWIWNTNPFMKSDNEAAIGAYRVDGTAKPELEPLVNVAKFIAANSHRMHGRRDEDVVMVIPHSQQFSTRNFATEATKRCVRAMYYHCRMPVRSVSEYRFQSLEGIPKLMIIPSPATLSDQAWQALLDLARKGSTVLISGPIDNDDHWLPVTRSMEFNITSVSRPVAQEEFISIDGVEYQLSYRGDKMQRLMKAVTVKEGLQQVSMISMGAGGMIWSPLPVELAEDVGPTAALYTYALKHAGRTPIFSVEKKDSSILIAPTVFADVVLYTFVSENDRDTEVRLTHTETGTRLTVTVPAQRTNMVFVNRKDGKIISRFI